MSSASFRPWPLIRLLPAKTSFRFVGFARVAGILSILAVIGSLTLCFTEGLKLGIDFKGGSSMELSAAPAAVDLGVVRATLNNLHVGDVQVQAIGTSGDALVRFQTPKGADASDTASHVKAVLASAIPNLKFTQSQVVGPKVSGELFRNGVLALAIAIGLMLIYIWFRFELQFGLGAVAALFHDVILTFGLFALFRLEFTLTIIAAILTIIGYSMNDTVVVFDRLRENLRKFRRTPLRDVIELSINETLSRTVITGLTAVLALGGLAIFGGEALRNFSIALIFGIVIGTYSSIYVASPIILLWGVKRGEDEAKAGGAQTSGAQTSGNQTSGTQSSGAKTNGRGGAKPAAAPRP